MLDGFSLSLTNAICYTARMKRPGAVGPYMTAGEVAQYLKIRQKAIYDLVREGKIPAFKLGADYRFIKSAIDEWVSNQQSRKSRRRPA